MSDEPIYGATMTIYASEGGGGAKWLLGAAAAALALGGGFLAHKNNAPTPAEAQVASYDPYAGEPLRAHPLPPSAEMLAARATAEEAAVAPHRAATRRVAHVGHAPVAAPAILEETIGVSAETDSDEIVVTRAQRPIWARRPSARRLSGLYPRIAMERGREGEASLQCVIQAGGRLDCERVSATSRSFGAAALQVVRRFRHAAQLADGSDAAGARLNLRILFRLADDDRRASA